MSMDQISAWVTAVNGIVWGPVMLGLILGTGLYLTLGLKLMPLRKLGFGFLSLGRGRKAEGEGDISGFSALMTALSATIGTGNIAGVATAIVLGGPGALFWMWLTALVGMATKYAEAVLAVRYREIDERGRFVGGPMYYIRNGMGAHWAWLGAAFALFGALAGFGIGNTVQANSVADVMASAFAVPEWTSGVVLMVLVSIVLIGGIRWIAEVASFLVPIMGAAYLLAGIIVLTINAAEIPAALTLIIDSAFSPAAAGGGFAGASVLMAIRWGVARGVFSNEAGLGSAAIAHAAATTRGPVNQGVIAMLGTFLDTIVVCSVTGLVIVTSGLWTSGVNGAALSSDAFEAALPGFGAEIVAIGLALFAFTTLLGWSYYSERCTEFLLGVKAIVPFRILWVLVIPAGAMSDLGFIWLLADTLNALMAIPNLIALIVLSPVVFSLTRQFFKEEPATSQD